MINLEILNQIEEVTTRVELNQIAVSYTHLRAHET